MVSSDSDGLILPCPAGPAVAWVPPACPPQEPLFSWILYISRATCMWHEGLGASRSQKASFSGLPKVALSGPGSQSPGVPYVLCPHPAPALMQRSPRSPNLGAGAILPTPRPQGGELLVWHTGGHGGPRRWPGPALTLLFLPHTPWPHGQCLAQELVSQKSLHRQGPDALVLGERQQLQPSVCRKGAAESLCSCSGGLGCLGALVSAA